MNMDRFKNIYKEERVDCIRCGKIAHYTELTEQGLCPDCAAEARERKREKEELEEERQNGLN